MLYLVEGVSYVESLLFPVAVATTMDHAIRLKAEAEKDEKIYPVEIRNIYQITKIKPNEFLTKRGD